MQEVILNQEALERLIAILPDLEAGLDVARDEQMRVRIEGFKQRLGDKIKANPTDPSLQQEIVKWTAMSRKMFWHHANNLKYPFSFIGLRDGSVTDQEIIDFFETIADPMPGSVQHRTKHT